MENASTLRPVKRTIKHWLTAVGLTMAFSASADTRLGFNYFPDGQYFSSFLADKNWRTANVKSTVERDLEMMASLGTESLRLMLFTFDESFPKQQGQTVESALFREHQRNLVEFIQLCQQYDIKVILTSSNDLAKASARFDSQYWRAKYSSEEAFLQDAVAWTTGLFSAVASQPQLADTILFYDLQNELYDYRACLLKTANTCPNQGGNAIREDSTEVKLVKRLYDTLVGSVIPQDKVGVSFLFSEEADLKQLKKELDPTGQRPFGYLDAHRYFKDQRETNAQGISCVKIENGEPVSENNIRKRAAYFRNNIKAFFQPLSDDRIILGETGYRAPAAHVADTRFPSGCTSPTTPQETLQRDFGFKATSNEFFLGSIRQAVQRNFPVANWWLFWDNNQQNQTFSPNYHLHQPKDILGSFASYMDERANQRTHSRILGAAKNPDMTSLMGVSPEYWQLEGNTNAQLLRVSAIDKEVTPSGDTYARVQWNNPRASELVQLRSDFIKAAPNKRVFSNFYFRAHNFRNIRLVVKEFDAQKRLLNTQKKSFVDSRSDNGRLFVWNNYLGRVNHGLNTKVAHPNAAFVTVGVEATVSQNLPSALLDVDVFSAVVR